MTSSEFTIDGVPYLLESSCEYRHWSVIRDRVVKFLERVGKDAAILTTAAVEGTTEINRELVSFKLTINPTGNPFRES